MRVSVPTTGAMVAAYLVFLEACFIRPNTYKAYRSDLTQFVALMPTELEIITLAQIQAYLDAGGVSTATSRRRRTCLRGFYGWLIHEDVLSVNPMDRLPMRKIAVREPRPLPDEVVQRVLGAIPLSCIRDRALFTLLYETGMRVGEALGIQFADLDFTAGIENVQVLGKGNSRRMVLLTIAPVSLRLLQLHLAAANITSGSVFRGDQRHGGSAQPLDYSVAHFAWHKYCAAAGVAATIHQLRHTRASLLIKAGVPLTTVCHVLGFRTIQSALIYAQVDHDTILHDLSNYMRTLGQPASIAG